jgi:hypothetical protein
MCERRPISDVLSRACSRDESVLVDRLLSFALWHFSPHLQSRVAGQPCGVSYFGQIRGLTSLTFSKTCNEVELGVSGRFATRGASMHEVPETLAVPSIAVWRSNWLRDKRLKSSVQARRSRSTFRPDADDRS